MAEYVTPAPVVTYTVPTLVFDCSAPAPAVSYAAAASAVEFVAPAPAVTYAASVPAIEHVVLAMDFQQTLDMIGALDRNTMTKQQLHTAIKVVLQFTKQFKSVLEGAQEVYDLSKVKLAALLRAQQALASSASRPCKVARR